VKQKLGASEKEKEELSQANERLQQEVDDKVLNAFHIRAVVRCCNDIGDFNTS